MGRLARQLESDRAIRNAARGDFDLRLAQVRSDLDARGVGGRVADKFVEDAQDIIDEAVDVADRHRGVIAGTIAALAIWFLRKPIIAWVEALIGDDDEEEADHDPN